MWIRFFLVINNLIDIKTMIMKVCLNIDDIVKWNIFIRFEQIYVEAILAHVWKLYKNDSTSHISIK